jgi:hypothetical protein
VLVSATLLSAALLLALVLDIVFETLRLQQDARSQAEAEVERTARQIDEALRPAHSQLRALAQGLREGPLTSEALLQQLEGAVRGDTPFLFEAGVAFAPYAWDPKVALYAPHVARVNEETMRYQREATGSYLNSQWFSSAMARGLGWTDTEVGTATGELLVSLSAPFHRASRPQEPLGVVRVNTSIHKLRDTLSTFTAGREQYGYLLSSMGTYLSHPIERHVEEQRTVFEVAGERGDMSLLECIRQALTGKAGFTKSFSELTGHQAWVFCEPIPTTGWVLVLVSQRAEAAWLPQVLWPKHVKALLSLMLTLSLLTCLLCGLHQPTKVRLWVASLSTALFFMGGIAFLWSRISLAPVEASPKDVEIFDRAGLERFQRDNATLTQQLRRVPARFVPSGLFVSTLRFSASNEAVVTGRLWQRYRLGEDDDLARGFTLPDAEQVTFQEAYRRSTAQEEVVGWNFRATLRQEFSDTRRYPFDPAALRIRLWHKDFDRNIILVPDLDGYNMLIPEARPGMVTHLPLSGWQVAQSFFHYEQQSLNSNLGIQDFTGQQDAPRLCFTLVARRALLDPFFASLMPILGVSSILFILLMCVSTDEEKRDRLGFKPMTALSVLAGTLFVVLVAQNNMRARVGAYELIFFEHFYFAAYTTIILVACTSILSSHEEPLRIFRYGNGLLPKLLFWPLSLGTWLLLTVIYIA